MHPCPTRPSLALLARPLAPCHHLREFQSSVSDLLGPFGFKHKLCGISKLSSGNCPDGSTEADEALETQVKHHGDQHNLSDVIERVKPRVGVEELILSLGDIDTKQNLCLVFGEPFLFELPGVNSKRPGLCLTDRVSVNIPSIPNGQRTGRAPVDSVPPSSVFNTSNPPFVPFQQPQQSLRGFRLGEPRLQGQNRGQ